MIYTNIYFHLYVFVKLSEALLSVFLRAYQGEALSVEMPFSEDQCRAGNGIDSGIRSSRKPFSCEAGFSRYEQLYG